MLGGKENNGWEREAAKKKHASVVDPWREERWQKNY